MPNRGVALEPISERDRGKFAVTSSALLYNFVTEGSVVDRNTLSIVSNLRADDSINWRQAEYP